MDHDYNLSVPREECDDEDIEDLEVDDKISKDVKINWAHTPTKSLNPKKARVARAQSLEDEDTAAAILHAVNALTQKMDEQTALLRKFEKCIHRNTTEIRKNKEGITELQEKVIELQKENKSLRSSWEEHGRYKRRWNLRLTGLPEKDDENTRETVIGILTRVVPMSVDRLRDTVDTVHRLGRKGNAPSSVSPRAIIIQFGMRTVRDDVWKKSRDARVCKELNIRFKEDFSKEDREARAKL
ncbi:cytoplasmic dynein 2 heavy chain 1-like protein [Clarias magur]|uniref:Cytoplasmic dynein 2 heavy chain 1-like protein n=1 Tax=Clarias magur TaxID=1594786 RepID=A0A8J4U1V1_CLAMG|nr:cytoplasmic dynein 2 heavy chain 1-like protein [Clarias magur]